MSRKPGSSIVSKCALVMDALAEARRPLAFAEIVAQTGFVKSSCHRILAILQSEELVEYNREDRTYQMGGRLNKWNRSAWYQADLQTAASGELTRLSETTDTNVALSVLDQGNLLYLLTADALAIRYAARAGDRAPLHCTAAGKVFLAHMSDAARTRILDQAEFERYTEFTKTRPEQLVAEIPSVLANGYGQAMQEEFLLVIGVAAPVRDIQNKVVACVSMWTLTSEMTKDELLAKTPDLIGVTQRLSKTIGWDAKNLVA